MKEIFFNDIVGVHIVYPEEIEEAVSLVFDYSAKCSLVCEYLLEVKIVIRKGSRPFDDYVPFITRELHSDLFECKLCHSILIYNQTSRFAIITIDCHDILNKNGATNLLCSFITELLSRSLMDSCFVPVHASAIERDSNSYLIMGHPGLGKTTTSLLLSNYGFRIINEDRPLINQYGFVIGFNRPIRVTKDSLVIISEKVQLLKEIYRDVGFVGLKARIPLSFFESKYRLSGARVQKTVLIRHKSDKYAFSPVLLSPKEAIVEIMKVSYAYYEKSEIPFILDVLTHFVSTTEVYLLDIHYSNQWIASLSDFLTPKRSDDGKQNEK